MKNLLFVITVVSALLLYMKDKSFSSNIDTKDNEIKSRINPFEKAVLINQDKIEIDVAEVEKGKVVEFSSTKIKDVVRSQRKLLMSTEEGSIEGSIDEIGGYFDKSASSPESGSQQIGEIDRIGRDAYHLSSSEMDSGHISPENMHFPLGHENTSSILPKI